jgi:hypothetical protein
MFSPNLTERKLNEKGIFVRSIVFADNLQTTAPMTTGADEFGGEFLNKRAPIDPAQAGRVAHRTLA